jgi:hypothetical protein
VPTGSGVGVAVAASKLPHDIAGNAHFGEKDRIAAGRPALTALTRVMETPKPAAASLGAAA